MHRAVVFLLFFAEGPSQMSESAGREYHRIQEPKNWTEAWDYCRSVFTDLASVRNLEEWEEVSRYAQQGEWIGLHNDNLTSSVWKWTTGEVFNYSNWEPWKPQELSTSSLSCVYTSTNQWFNADCDIPLSFICHKELMSLSTEALALNAAPTSGSGTADLPETLTKSEPEVKRNYPPVWEAGQLKVSITTKPNSWAVQPTKASDAEPLAAPVSREGDTSTDRATDSSETGLHLISKLSGRSYHLVPEMKSWAQAREHCQRMFTDLASIPSREEEGVIIHFAAPGERLWIGLYNDGQSPNGWKWTTGESFSYNNWAPWYTEDFNTTFPICVYIDVDQWMDTNCDITLSFICYKDPLQQLIAPDSEALLAKPANLSGTEIPVPLSAEGPKASSLQTTTTIEREKDNFQTLEAFLTNLSSSGEFPTLSNVAEDGDLTGKHGNMVEIDEIQRPSLHLPKFRASHSEGRPLIDNRMDREYYVINEERTWKEARDYCQRNHTDLVSFRNPAEEEFVRSLVSQEQWSWIGLYNEELSNSGWKWTNGDNFTYSNWGLWYPEQFNTSSSSICVCMDRDEWFDLQCDFTLPFICYADTQQLHPVLPRENITPAIGVQKDLTLRETISRRNFRPAQNQTILSADRKYFLIEEEKTWNKAWNYCRNHYTNLVSMRSAEEASLVSMLVHEPQWIGLYTDGMSGWMWTNGDPFNYSKWGLWHPYSFNNSLPMCVTIFDGEWHEADCDFPFNFICYQDLKSSSRPPGFPAGSAGPTVKTEITYGSKDYSDLLSDLNVDSAPKRLYHKVNRERTWPDARDYCRLHYTDLVSIRSEQENNATRALFGELRQAWCGLYNEQQMADSWEWADGSSVTYVHWKPGQPHRYSLLSPVCVYVQEGQWIDGPCRYLLPFVCYTDLLQGAKQQAFAPIDFDLLSSVDEQTQISMLSARNPFTDPVPVAFTKDYVLVKQEKMWNEAQNHCRAEYSDLASIQSLEENALVAQALQSDVPAWIGLFNRHQSEYSWMWANGDEFNFSNWDHFYPMDFSTMSVCVIMLNDRWKDVPCDFNFPFVCYVGSLDLKKEKRNRLEQIRIT